MNRFRVEWRLLPQSSVPRSIRAAVEGRLLLLWRFLDCARPVSRAAGHCCRSEHFRIDEDSWTFTYEIDLLARAAVVGNAVAQPAR
jgi:hypothetical protein